MMETVFIVSSKLSYHTIKSRETALMFRPNDFDIQICQTNGSNFLPNPLSLSSHTHSYPSLRMDLTAVKRVESPVKYKQLKPVMNSNSDNHIQYEIQFPAGSMGLELEPVIISSERKIGCRVKDFYFGVDYTGTEEDRSMLQGTISIGDILMKINGISVVSLPFTSVLDMLRSLTSTERVVVFKNLTKSCKFI